MNFKDKDTGSVKKSRLFLCVAIWWLVVVIGYAIISFKIEKIKNHITQSGVALLHEVTGKISLPLLEHDVTSLRKILQDVEKRSGVSYASILDHKNKIIAYTDPNQLLPVKSDRVSSSDHVSFWEGSSNRRSRVINFSTDIIYAGTRIGKFYLSYSAVWINRIRYGFIIIAISIFIILVLVLTGLYSKGLRSITGALKTRYSSKVPFDLKIFENSNMSCPLCGAEQPFSRERFSDINLDKFLIVKSIQDGSNTVRFRPLKGIGLSEVSNREDLVWLKRQVIFRCTEIIKKLAVE
ncbi:MAG: hypothetical protein SRB2_02540 [Desulfobacteraceae bacterium Eth-SRB2]|nr:MAG: hypothetical protein SRB2_02540 [Desulfobacteraceae bacterium Eth-SRB2]